MTCVVFFYRLATAPLLALPPGLHVALQQFPASAPHGGRVEPEQLGDLLVPARPGPQRFQPGVQASLPLIEQAEKQHESRFDFVGDLGRDVVVSGVLELSGSPLLGFDLRVRRGVPPASVDLFPMQLAAANESQQGLFDFHSEPIFEFVDEASRIGVLSELKERGLECSEQ
ncbi:MAG: hypothetical protein O3A00_28090 [Planctomycetota bacterium]|nr:hypothetical protein [Planctomycetota bacterium]